MQPLKILCYGDLILEGGRKVLRFILGEKANEK